MCPQPFGLSGRPMWCSIGNSEPCLTMWQIKTRALPVVQAPQSHLNRNHFTSKQSATTPRHNSHPLCSETASTNLHMFVTLPASLSQLAPACYCDLSQDIPPCTHILSSTLACTWWVPACHTNLEGATCSLYISGREQAANYKTTLGAWLFLGIAAVLLHAEWGKWACQPSPVLLWWVQMR